MKINFGCGSDYRIGWVNTDTRDKVKADLYFNLDTFPYPIQSNKADYIYANHIIEHLNHPIQFMEECHRILKVGGILEVSSAHISQLESIGELDHKRHGLGVFSMHIFTNLHVAKRDYYSQAQYKIKKVSIKTHPFWQWIANLSVIKYEKYFSRFLGAREIRFFLEKI